MNKQKSSGCENDYCLGGNHKKKLRLLLLLLLSYFSRVLLCVTPIEGSPPGSPVPGILQARTLEWVAISDFIFQTFLDASTTMSFLWDYSHCSIAEEGNSL